MRASGAIAWAIGMTCGCAHVENHFREDGPASSTEWNSPTAMHILAENQPAAQRRRDWDAMHTSLVSGGVTHWPVWFEDPFVDKGSGNGPFDEFGTGANEYRGGWEDYLALVYSPARQFLNLICLPGSAIVTPPWAVMESDGHVSRQILGHDHDATVHIEPKAEGADDSDGAAPSSAPS